MQISPIEPWRVMVCAGEHPSGERIFILRGLPGRYQVTPAMPEELTWMRKNGRKFQPFLAKEVDAALKAAEEPKASKSSARKRSAKPAPKPKKKPAPKPKTN